MKILVTGGSGTIGGYVLRELLGAGHSVSDHSRTPPLVEGARFIQGDIMDLPQLEAACPGHDAIIHLAAVPGPGRAAPEQLISSNVNGTAHVLEAAVHSGVPKVVLASSGAATGFSFQKHELTPKYLPLDEDHPCEPHDEYGLSKLLGEIACKRYSDAYGLQTICLRINHNWYLDWAGAQVAVRSGWAKGTVEELWTKRYRRCLEADEATVWTVPGPPPPKNLLWAVTDARDAAQAFRLAVENDSIQHGIFQINGEDTCSTVETPDLIARHFPGVPLKARLEGYMSLISCAQATRLLGYRPQYTWRDSDFSRWLQGQREAIAGERLQ
jgi:nucleoside-diphosphate-sugar epimerase